MVLLAGVVTLLAACTLPVHGANVTTQGNSTLPSVSTSKTVTPQPQTVASQSAAVTSKTEVMTSKTEVMTSKTEAITTKTTMTPKLTTEPKNIDKEEIGQSRFESRDFGILMGVVAASLILSCVMFCIVCIRSRKEICTRCFPKSGEDEGKATEDGGITLVNMKTVDSKDSGLYIPGNGVSMASSSDLSETDDMGRNPKVTFQVG